MEMNGKGNANDYSNCNGNISGKSNGINNYVQWTGSDYGKSNGNGIDYGKGKGINKSNGNSKVNEIKVITMLINYSSKLIMVKLIEMAMIVLR